MPTLAVKDMYLSWMGYHSRQLGQVSMQCARRVRATVSAVRRVM